MEVVTAVARVGVVKVAAKGVAAAMEEGARAVEARVVAVTAVERVAEGRAEGKAVGARAVEGSAQNQGALGAVKGVVDVAALTEAVDSVVAAREAVGRRHASLGRASSPHVPAACASIDRALGS